MRPVRLVRPSPPSAPDHDRESAPDDVLEPISVPAIRAGDMRALTLCYRAHARHLRTVALRLTGTMADAEDVVHDVFVQLPKSMVHYEERGQLRAWLTRLTIHASLTHRRHERVRAALPLDVADGVASPTVDGDPIAAARVLRALGELTPALRHVFVLRAVHDYSHTEIGAALDISTDTSEVRLHRAVKQLREILEQIR